MLIKKPPVRRFIVVGVSLTSDQTKLVCSLKICIIGQIHPLLLRCGIRIDFWHRNLPN